MRSVPVPKFIESIVLSPLQIEKDFPLDLYIAFLSRLKRKAFLSDFINSSLLKDSWAYPPNLFDSSVLIKKIRLFLSIYAFNNLFSLSPYFLESKINSRLFLWLPILLNKNSISSLLLRIFEFFKISPKLSFLIFKSLFSLFTICSLFCIFGIFSLLLFSFFVNLLFFFSFFLLNLIF